MSKLCAAFRVSFSTERSTIKVYWGQSERLTPGSLVALSPSKDNFKTKCIVAVVTARTLVGGLEPDLEAGEDETYPPRIDIFLSNPEDSFFDPGEGFVMLETAESYFESVRHTMVGLQHAALHPLVLYSALTHLTLANTFQFTIRQVYCERLKRTGHSQVCPKRRSSRGFIEPPT